MKKDLAIIVPCLDIKVAIDAILKRPSALGIRQITYGIDKHIHKDSGCFLTGPDVLRMRLGQAEHALIVFDRHGCGQEHRTARDLADDVRTRLEVNGWVGRADAVCLDPELEAWVWSPSPWVAAALGWANRRDELTPFLKRRGLWDQGLNKPSDPKRAVEAALREARRPISPTLYEQLATQTSLRRCSDPSFIRLRAILRTWFPV